MASLRYIRISDALNDCMVPFWQWELGHHTFTNKQNPYPPPHHLSILSNTKCVQYYKYMCILLYILSQREYLNNEN